MVRLALCSVSAAAVCACCLYYHYPKSLDLFPVFVSMRLKKEKETCRAYGKANSRFHFDSIISTE